MAAPLKHILNEDAVRWLAEGLATADPKFDRRRFIAACIDGLERLDLKARAGHIAAAMHACLPADFPEAARIVAASLGPENPPMGQTGLQVLRYMPHDCFIARYGLDCPQAAFRLQEKLTKRFSCEFSIRFFIERHPEAAGAQLKKWARDGNAHLRRLVSEGTRPRLPWAPRLRAFQKDPTPVIALLEELKDDPARYVRRSVANNINDIGKDHPGLAVELCRRWLIGAPPGRRWIVKHAMRDLVRKSHAGALELFGAHKAPKVKIGRIALAPARLRLGGALRFGFNLASLSARRQDLIVDYVVHFVKANGQTRPKVFKFAKLSLPAGMAVDLSGKVSFADLTTRKHYPGLHKLAAQINGKEYALAQFHLHAADRRSRPVRVASRHSPAVRAGA
jgi:3-methyladenine DNA glycosylase AlkC